MFFALIVLLVGWWLVNRVSKIFMIFLNKSSVDSSIVSFLDSLIKFSLRVLLCVLVLSALKINVFSIVAAISASLVALGLALKDSISNFAAGILVILNKPINLGDHIEVTTAKGVVSKIDLAFTVLQNEDKTVIIPNSLLISAVITRKGERDSIKNEFNFKLCNTQKLKSLKSALERHLAFDGKVLTTPSPEIHIKETNDEPKSIELHVIFWAQRKHCENVRNSQLEFINLFLSKNDVKIVESKLL
jgi:small conductance mechanosensitive channel